jgi:hypothetical protein
MILCSELRGTHDHILLSHGSRSLPDSDAKKKNLRGRGNVFIVTRGRYTDCPLKRHELIEHDAPNISSNVAFILCRGNVFIEPFPSTEWRNTLNWAVALQRWEGYTYRQRMMWWIYEVRRWDGLRYHDIRTKFHKYWFRHSEVEGGGDTQTGLRSHKPTLGNYADEPKCLSGCGRFSFRAAEVYHENPVMITVSSRDSNSMKQDRWSLDCDIQSHN